MTTIVTPPTMTAPPPAPVTSDTQAEFNTKAFNLVGWFVTLVSNMTAALANVFNNATAAEERAVTAQGHATAAAGSVTTAAGHVTSAQTASSLAYAYAQSAVNAPGTSGTSTTSMSVSSGGKNFTTQTGKNWVPGQPVVISRISEPNAKQMYGILAGYNPSTGGMYVEVPTVGVVGSGTYSDWSIALTGQRGPEGLSSSVSSSATINLSVGQRVTCAAAAATTFVMPSSPSPGDRCSTSFGNGRTDNLVNFNGANHMANTDTTMSVPYKDVCIDWEYINSGYGWKIV